VLNYTGGEVNAKIVYYGPGLSGKTTNLEFIHDRTPEGSRGKMVSMKTQTDRTLFFDFLPLELGDISGYRTRFLLYTVPGQVYYNATRKLVLKGVDAVVFVADSARGKLDENLESLRNLEQNLNEHGLSLDEIPWVIQYNKRDAADAMAVADLDARLNPLRVPSFEAVATMGNGVYETFHGIATLVYRVLKERLERELDGATGMPSTAPGQPRAAAPVAKPQPAAASQPASAGGEIEFDSAIDSALREMDRPAARPAPHAAPAASPVQRTVNNPAPAVPAAPVAVTPAPSAAPAGVAVAEQPQPAAPHTDSGGFERFDNELGRLPELDEAVFASDSARNEGPNEFVTDPMRRPSAVNAPAKPQPAPAPAPLPPVAPPLAVTLPDAPQPETHAETHAETVIEVPVELSASQVRSGAPIRVVLSVRVKNE
jgi:signal recognition particle receptor subunit beta